MPSVQGEVIIAAQKQTPDVAVFGGQGTAAGQIPHIFPGERDFSVPAFGRTGGVVEESLHRNCRTHPRHIPVQKRPAGSPGVIAVPEVGALPVVVSAEDPGVIFDHVILRAGAPASGLVGICPNVENLIDGVAGADLKFIVGMATAEKYYKEADHDNFKLNIVNVIDEDIQTRFSTAFSAGVTDELPDIVLMGDSWANMYLTNFPGCYVDLTDEIDFSEFAPYKVSCFTVDGRVYGVPFDSGSAGLFYRTDILEEAGFQPSDLEDITLWDLLEIAKVIREKTGKYGLGCCHSNSRV